jgi:hypothetical protein
MASAMISGLYLPSFPSFTIAFLASEKETFRKRKSSTTIFGVMMKRTFANLAALIALPSSVANNDSGMLRATFSASASPRCKDTGNRGFGPEGVVVLIRPRDMRSSTKAASGCFLESSLEAVSETTEGGTRISKVAHAISNTPHFMSRIIALLSRTRRCMVDKVHRKRFIRIVNEYNASVNMKGTGQNVLWIGFRRDKEEEPYEMLADWDGQRKSRETVLGEIHQAYSQEKILVLAKVRGYAVTRNRVNEKRQIEMVLRKIG